MNSFKMYNRNAQRPTSEKLDDVAFVLGVVGSLFGVAIYIDGNVGLLGQLAVGWLLGMAATFKWAALVLKKPRVDASIKIDA